VKALLEQAEEILDTAIRAGKNASGIVILMDRQGGMRMLDPAGWTMAGLTAEFGASAVFKVNKGSGTTSVEGWAGSDRCLIERQTGGLPLAYLPLTPAICHPIRLHATPLSIAQPDARDSAVWNRY
jgi:hypothetical protein